MKRRTLYEQWSGLIDWTHEQIRHSADNLMRDARSLRASWNWIYLALFVFECVWAALFYPKALPTAIVTTGTIVGTIFTVYVLSTTKERLEKMKNGYSKKPGVQDDVDGSD